MTTLAAVLITALVMGYPLHRAHVRLSVVESELDVAHDLLGYFFRTSAVRHLRSVDGAR